MANNNQSAESKTYKQQAGDFYNRQYDNWVPWMEDKYLQWFTKDNKASYATKRTSTSQRSSAMCPTLPFHSPHLSYQSTRRFSSQTPHNTDAQQRTSTKRKSPASTKSTTYRTASTASCRARSARAGSSSPSATR
jgi:hypothetical protein